MADMKATDANRPARKESSPPGIPSLPGIYCRRASKREDFERGNSAE